MTLWTLFSGLAPVWNLRIPIRDDCSTYTEFESKLSAILEHAMDSSANYSNIDALASTLFTAHLNGELESNIAGFMPKSMPKDIKL